MHRKNYWRSLAALAMAACIMSVSAGSMSVAAQEATESERIKIGSDFSKREKEEMDTEETETETESEAQKENASDQKIGNLIGTTELLEEKDQQSLPDISAVAENVMPSIVAITNAGVETISYYGTEYQMDSESTGSGIIVGKNDSELLIATNQHVVEGAEELTVCFTVDAEDKDKLVPAQVKGTDSTWDLAVIAVNLSDISEDVAGKIKVAQMGDSDQTEVGEYAVAIGNALGYGQSVTFGIISALNREISVSTNNGVVTNPMIQTDAAINFGNSGGALLNLKGELIGINSAKAAETGVEGMGYAIPVNTAKPIIEDLMNQVTRTKVRAEDAGALGLVPVDVSEEARQIYNIPTGAFVYELTEGSAAEKAGIRECDIIVKLDKTGISSKSELLDRMQYYAAGETVAVTVKRSGADGYEEKVIEVELGKKSDLPGYQNSTQDDSDTQDSEEETEGSDNSQDGEGYQDWYDFGGRGQIPFSDGNGDLGDLFRYFGF